MQGIERLVHVLLVEDNPADVHLTRETLESGKLHVELSVVSDGVEALDFLRGLDKYGEAPRPDLVLLDLNLPRLDGRGVLAEMKNSPGLRAIPVVVLTSSTTERDIAESYGLGANCYIAKPVGFKAFQEIVASVEDFWFTVVKLPTSGSISRKDDEP